MAHGSQGLFTQAGVNDPLQDDASQVHFGMGAPGPLQSQVFRLCFFSLYPLLSSFSVLKTLYVGNITGTHEQSPLLPIIRSL